MNQPQGQGGISSRPDVIIVNGPELFEVAARRFVAAIGEAVGQRGTCAVCLSGGSTPQGLYRVLARPEYTSRISWDRVHIFWGDERCVAPNHPLSNYLVAQLGLLSHIPITPAQVHRVPVETGTAEQVAARYQEELAQHFGTTASSGAPPRFDLLLLGVGTDGHTASLFPHARQLKETARWVVAAERPGELLRVTLTLPVLNAARQIHFLVQGGDKAEAVYHAIEKKGSPETWPASLVRPVDGRALWFIDGAAASLLKSVKGTGAAAPRVDEAGAGGDRQEEGAGRREGAKGGEEDVAGEGAGRREGSKDGEEDDAGEGGGR